MEEWKEYKIGDVCNIKHGFAFKGIHFVDEWQKYIAVTPGNFCIGGGFKLDKLKFYNGPISSDYILKEDDLVVTMTDLSKAGDTLGYSALIPHSKDYVFLHNQRIGLVENISSDIDKHFLYWIMRTYNYQRFIVGHSSGSTVKHTSPSNIGKYVFKCPSIEKQQKIVSILDNLDDKIEVNRRINEQLEELAQALFKSWFVDFEPFKDGKFVESELGMIPEGWKVGTLGDVAMITKGTTPTTLGYSFTYNGIPFIKAESIRDNHTIDFDKTTYISLEANEKLCRSIIKKYDILFTIAGTLGRFCFAPQTLEIANTNQAVAIIRVHKLFNPISIYSMLLGKWHTEYCYRNIQQAVQANLSLGTLKKMPILIPPFDIIKKYEECIFPIFMKFESLNEEITHLTNLRDTLLPKLMSGEIDVNEVEI